ncbi:bifunctional diaminohydroxyphosphoribosylaminopyrimidine deaminase/5-amino-6-(5-phosphoribosylamino)uracil reductase RibD [Anoxybacterium hadale]|uniref:bifunctional diaminohydroxyphosphoribosylaminopyrimidine deaminase/5-amino-6-(5-phosphoribosylamino)uracil reductase RibD n=1 Tax=Anoxybacterium hadale TaxID=3408580 RepID=UPI003AFFCBD1
MCERTAAKLDETFMARAIELARRGEGKTAPNPLVGAILVKNGCVIGEGWHECFGQAHAEVNVIRNAKKNHKDPSGSTLYVNLEPCCHYGKTPPCTELIIKSGIIRVVIGIMDPNPLVAGRGTEALRRAGITVASGVLEEDCRRLNEIFIHFITTKRPFVTIKAAVSLDGKTAAYTGASKWITGEHSRREVQLLRNSHTAVMVGVNTVLADDPELTCRMPGGRSPRKIILDSHLRIPKTSKIMTGLGSSPGSPLEKPSCKDEQTILACSEDADTRTAKELEALGAMVLRCKSKEGRVDLDDLMNQLGALGIDSILLEGGGTVNAAAFSQGIVNKLLLHMAPKILGGASAKTFVEGLGVPSPDCAQQFRIQDVGLYGEDIRITAYPSEATS